MTAKSETLKMMLGQGHRSVSLTTPQKACDPGAVASEHCARGRP